MFIQTDEQIQDDKDEQFAAMDYTVECNTCGEQIRYSLLWDDFNRPVLIKDLQDAMYTHNMTHYEKPMIHRCKDDDIFGVDHSECNHRVTVNADGSF